MATKLYISYEIARETFKINPSEDTAARLLTAALNYWGEYDSIVTVGQIRDDMELVRDWLARNKGVQHD